MRRFTKSEPCAEDRGPQIPTSALALTWRNCAEVSVHLFAELGQPGEHPNLGVFTIMASLKHLAQEIEKIQARNERVETDKAWETSKTRRLILSLATYIIIASFLLVSNVPNPWFNALIPTLAFVLSTLTLPVFKRAWARHIYSK